MAGILSGISAFGHAIGVGSSYGAFMAPLGHIAARLHAIGAQARRAASGRALQAADPGLRPRRPQDRRGRPDPRRPAGAAAAAGELPAGTAITLTPWEPQEIWPLWRPRSPRGRR